MNDKIYILSTPVHSGKTTMLMNWIKDRKQIAGLLMPDVDGLRKLYNIRTDVYYDIQQPERNENTLSICKWDFDHKIFELGRNILLEALHQPHDWLVIDEVGKLEIHQHLGFEPAVTEVIKVFQSGRAHGKLLLVIRDYLLQPAMEKYQLVQPHVIHSMDKL